jgi:NADPH:quinone reductase-like Zn-dependent oxidoreductase
VPKQGTGGVSKFALQFVKTARAKVTAMASSAAKADLLKGLGADHITVLISQAICPNTVKL